MEEIDALRSVEDSMGRTVLVLATEQDHARADDLYRRVRETTTAVETDARYVKARDRLKLLQETIRTPVRVLERYAVMLSASITVWRKAEAEKARQEALAAARKDVGKQAAATPAGAKVVEQAAESAVARIVAQQKETRKEAGQTSTQTLWHAEVDDVALLVAAIVASNDAIWTTARELRKPTKRAALGRVPVEAVMGLRRAKTTMAPYDHVSSPTLNALAKSLEKNLSIPGVRAVSADTVVNRW